MVATEDGSLGHHGMVTDLLPGYLEWPDQVFVCGPRPMLPAVKSLAASHQSRFQVSLEERMACGVGACLGCVVDTRRGPRRVCRDGPVFKLEDLEIL
jgi:dihydroorotate dehydrogenase electron transfer subunit